MRALPRLVVAGIVTLCLGASAYAANPQIHIRVPYMMTVRILDEAAGSYQVEVDNTNPFKFIDKYVWTPPPGMTIVKITSTIGATCHLPADGTVVCTGQAAGPGGIGEVGSGMIVDFTASGNQPKFVSTSYGGYYIHYGVIGTVAVTEGTFSDVPLCTKGQASTKTKPCSTT